MQSVYRIQVLERTFALLDLLKDSDSALGITEVCAKVSLSKSTAHRILMILERHRYVERSRTSGKYRLGAKLFELGSSALGGVDLADRVRPCLERLVEQTGETAHFGVLRQGEVISLFHVQTKWALGSPSTVGRRAPVYCTSLGKAILALLPESEAAPLVQSLTFHARTPKTIVRASALQLELHKIRKLGYAVDNEEFEEGLKCIACAVRDHTAKVIGAISIAGPAFRLAKARMPVLTSGVVDAAASLSSSLGYRRDLGERHREEKS